MEEEFVCHHLEYTREMLVNVIRKKNITTLEKLMDETDVGSVCGSCIHEVESIFYETLMQRDSAKKP